jgi:uncharacterized protein (DUF362 family)
MSEPIPVLLDTCKTYDTPVLKQFCDDAAAALGFGAGLGGARVLLKPNLISSMASRLACSDGRFIRAVAEWFIDQGARVRIGDSPSFGSASQVMAKHGISDHLRGLDIEVIEFRDVRELEMSHEVRIGVSGEALDCDLLVNLPRVKAHGQMYVTLAVKNRYGVVCGMRKAVRHMMNGLSHVKFGDLMIDLCLAVPHSVSLIDGIEVMHRSGPIKGVALQVGCVAAAKDPVALDTALLAALELDLSKCPVWRAAKARTLAGAEIDRLEFVRLAPERFSGTGFEAPEFLSPVPFNPLRFMYNSYRRVAASRQTLNSTTTPRR